MITAPTPNIENSFGVTASCDSKILISDRSCLTKFWQEGLFKKPYFIIGSGYNIIPPFHFKGAIIKSNMRSVCYSRSRDGATMVSVDAGVCWDDFVKESVDRGLQGLENLSLIPGTVGAAPIQNIGAYGSEVSERIHSVECFNTLNGEFEVIDYTDCQFGYRTSAFKNRRELFIVSVTFAFPEAAKIKNIRKLKDALFAGYLVASSIRIKSYPKPKASIAFNNIRRFLELPSISIKLKRKLVVFIRKKTLKDPVNIGNSGCFFKCPIVSATDYSYLRERHPYLEFFTYSNDQYKVSACSLIRAAGFSGLERDGVACDTNRPVVLLNRDNASSLAVSNYVMAVKSAVQLKFGIELEEEVVRFFSQT